MKTLLPLLILLLLSLPSSAATDPRDRTSMPSNCSDRDVNCVINDGPPRKRSAVKKQDKKEKEKEKRGNTPPGMDRAGGGPASGAIVDPAGVTRK